MTTTSYCDTQGVDPNIWIQLDKLNKELIEISKEIQSEMSNLRSQDVEIKKRIHEKKEKLGKYIKTLEKDSNTLKNNNFDMDTLQGGYEDSVLVLREKSYKYLAWSFVAVASSLIIIRQATQKN